METNALLRRRGGRWWLAIEVEYEPLRRLDPESWLAQCEQFLVEASGRTVGLVEEVRAAAGRAPLTVIVRLHGGGLVPAAVEDIDEVDFAARRLRLRALPPEGAQLTTQPIRSWRRIRGWLGGSAIAAIRIA